MAPFLELMRRPVQPPVPDLDIKGRRTEHQQRHPLASIFSDITQHSPNRVGVFKVMLIDQFLIETLAFRVLDEANRDLLQ
jgi:hypothetical protein